MSDERKFTQGEWEWLGTNKHPNQKCYLWSDHNEVVLFLPEDSLTDANANLLAAAPNLYSALVALSEWFDAPIGKNVDEMVAVQDKLRSAANKALAKARGEQP